MSDLWNEPEGGTPLDPNERDGLIPDWVATRADLNEAEQANIAHASAWARLRRRGDLFTEPFVRLLHHHMFNDVWRWAGRYRTTGKNLGIDAHEIPQAVAQAVSDARYWIDNEVFAGGEIGIRLHHRMTLIHPFPNGNGRLARLVADLAQIEQGAEPFTWGSQNLSMGGDSRALYIAALKAADGHDLAPLRAFAQS